jgi:NTE family protein
MHEVIVASCYIPILYARVPRVDGEVHIDGGAADNTLIDELIARGADDITVVTPFTGGAVARTMFSTEQPPKARRGVSAADHLAREDACRGRASTSRRALEDAGDAPRRDG